MESKQTKKQIKKLRNTENRSVVARGYKRNGWGFPGGAVVESLPANAGHMGSSPGLGRSHMPRSN